MRSLVSSLLLLLALPLFSATTREVHTVEVVQVPVYVSTPAGAVTGLTRDNFELFVNGKRQPFQYFDVVDFASSAAAARPDPRQRRLYCLVFDLFYASPNEIHRAQVAAAQIVERAARDDVFGVATYTMRRGVDVLVPFTHDRAATVRAIASLRPSLTADPLRLAVTARELADLTTDRQRMGVSSTETPVFELAADRLRATVDDQIGALGLLARQLAPLEGQKHVVLLSGGFDAGLLHGSFTRERTDFVQRMSVNTPARQQQQRVPIENGQALKSLREMTREYTAAGVFLDAIDIAGIRPTADPAANESLYALTIDTGGTVVEHRNDLVEAFDALRDRQRVVYVLGFQAPEKAHKQNAIEVRLRGVEGKPDVRYRPSYAPISTTASADNGLRLADILINDIPQTGVTMNVGASGPTVNVSIPARELLAQIDGKTAEAEALIYVFEGSRVVATRVKRIDIDAERAAGAAGNATIHFAESFTLPPGDYEAKVLVRLGDAMGFAKTSLTVPR